MVATVKDLKDLVGKEFCPCCKKLRLKKDVHHLPDGNVCVYCPNPHFHRKERKVR